MVKRMKLWEKGYSLDEEVELFMTGDDPVLDKALAIYDCLGSIAHAKMLHHIGILSAQELASLHNELIRIVKKVENEQFAIAVRDEDVHTAIENALVKALGDVGKKLHTARSRNDQVLLDIRLYARDKILQIAMQLLQAVNACVCCAMQHVNTPMVGRTHFQKAMPSSVGLWASSFAESFLDDMELLKTAYELIDQCPLGSAASYGVSLPIDRKMVSDLLGFRTVQNNVLYANNSRGKFEAIVVNAFCHVMQDMAKVCTDVIVFCAPEFGYFTLPDRFCPGSSLMPQKKNPCPFELIRAKATSVQAALFQIHGIINALPSGYNRDFQETKRPFMFACDTTYTALRTFTILFSGLQVNYEACVRACSPEIFATDAVLDLVKAGVPFRDAYAQIATTVLDVMPRDAVANIVDKQHQGAPGNLQLSLATERVQEYHQWIVHKQNRWERGVHSLLQEENSMFPG
jgi:argininosuccinate lyase